MFPLLVSPLVLSIPFPSLFPPSPLSPLPFTPLFPPPSLDNDDPLPLPPELVDPRKPKSTIDITNHLN